VKNYRLRWSIDPEKSHYSSIFGHSLLFRLLTLEDFIGEDLDVSPFGQILVGIFGG
jgi:hypothetical protein